MFLAIKSSIKLIKPSKILIKSLLIQICVSLPQIQIFSSNGSFVNQNWIINFVNLVHSGPLTFHLSFWSFTINLGNLLGFFHVYLLAFWIAFSFFFSFLDFFSWVKNE